MSLNGIHLVAAVLSNMQETRRILLAGDKQDIRLGQLLEGAKDTMKWPFARITLEKRSTDTGLGKDRPDSAAGVTRLKAPKGKKGCKAV